MIRALTVALALVVWSAPALTRAVPPQRGSGQSQAPRFRTSTERVRVDAIVTDKGRPVAGLTPADFEMKDNGIPVRDLEVTTSSETIAVAIVLDLSGSVQAEGLQELINACQALAGALQSGDEAWFVTFADSFALKAGPVRDPAVIRRALTGIRPGGGTSMWDALFGSVSLVHEQAGRSMVLVFTDGADSTSWMGEDRGLETLRRSPVVVSAIRPPFVPDGFMQLERAAIATGGVVVTAQKGARLETQFVDLLREFRLGYILSYAPTGVAAKNGWHEIDVRLKGKSGKVRARKGYFEPGR